MKRCAWCNLNNEIYVNYHDNEWGVLNLDDTYLFEMLILELFQAGLSFECVLNKREYFKEAYDNFDVDKVSLYDENKINELMNNYLKTFTNDKVIYENDKTTSKLSDAISTDLKRRGMKFIGSTIIYAYLQAVGIINSHDDSCYKHAKKAS